MKKSFEGKAVVITGAGSGMGKSMALLFAAKGANVIVSDINEQRVNDVVKEITSAGGIALACITNVSKEEDVKK